MKIERKCSEKRACFQISLCQVHANRSTAMVSLCRIGWNALSQYNFVCADSQAFQRQVSAVTGIMAASFRPPPAFHYLFQILFGYKVTCDMISESDDTLLSGDLYFALIIMTFVRLKRANRRVSFREASC